MATERPVDIADIQRHVATRAPELGGTPRDEDIVVVRAPLETPRNMWVFRAQWLDHNGSRALTGIWDGEEIISYPLKAIGRLLEGWHEESGRLPSPETLASVCAFILDAEQRRHLLLKSESLPAQAPQYAQGEMRLPLWFYWQDERGRRFRVAIDRDAASRITYDAIWVSDQLEPYQ